MVTNPDTIASISARKRVNRDYMVSIIPKNALRVNIPLKDQYAYRDHAKTLRALADRLDALSDSGSIDHFAAYLQLETAVYACNSAMKAQTRPGQVLDFDK